MFSQMKTNPDQHNICRQGSYILIQQNPTDVFACICLGGVN